MKQAILIASFGTTHLDTLERNIARLEDTVRQAFPGRPVYRAFLSGVIRKKLERVYGIRIPSVEQVLEQLREEGFETVTVQPTLLIPGEEYERFCASVEKAAGNLQIRMGRPLLEMEADLDRITEILHRAYPTDDDTCLLLMGHGTVHPANDLYVRLSRKLRENPALRMHLTTVEGTPTFADAVQELLALPQRKAQLAPMMLVAGDHACNDMSGPEEESLRSMLTKAGFEVRCRIQGLGELEEIRVWYTDRIREITE